MKAGHILLLLIALIAVSHVRRDMLTGKKQSNMMNEYSMKAVPENTDFAGNRPAARYTAGISGTPKNNNNASLYYFKSKQ
jgi:hypothetical protein